jgi:hypothetical protein
MVSWDRAQGLLSRSDGFGYWWSTSSRIGSWTIPTGSEFCTVPVVAKLRQVNWNKSSSITSNSLLALPSVSHLRFARRSSSLSASLGAMSLSVGTLNLKFMQRGAAKSGAAIPEAVPRGVLAAEQEARWVLPRRTGANASASTSERKPGIDASVDGSAPAGPSRAGGVGGVTVSYESSYVPFITETGGGGRMRFGGFGQAEEQPEGEGEGEGDDDGEDAEAEEGEAKVRRQVAVRVSRRGLLCSILLRWDTRP